RPNCTSITHPVANQSWCARGLPPNYVWQVWNGTTWVNVGGGASLVEPANQIVVGTGTSGASYLDFQWDETTSNFIIDLGGLSTITGGANVLRLDASTVTANNSVFFDLVGGSTLATNETFQVNATHVRFPVQAGGGTECLQINTAGEISA